MKITIIIEKNNEEILSRVLNEGVYRIGRSEFSEIVLDDKSVSRQHIELRVTEHGVYMTNMSSTAPVLVNNIPKETAELTDGDKLKAGVFQILVFHGDRLSQEKKESADDSENKAAINSPLEAAEQGENKNPIDNLDSPKVDLPVPDSPDDLIINPDFKKQDENKSQVKKETQDPNIAEIEAISPKKESTVYGETQLELKPIVAKLLFIEGPKKGEEIFIETFEVTIGRSKKADIYIDDEKLSRMHAKISRVGIGYRLIDLNSRNGTYVNGVRILEHPLSSFDEIQIGNSKIRFFIHDIVMASEKKAAVIPKTEGSLALDQTRSLQLEEAERRFEETIEIPIGVQPPQKRFSFKFIKPAIIAIFILVALLLVLPGKKESDKKSTSSIEKETAPTIVHLPKGYDDLSSDEQRQIEGYYNSAINAASQEEFDVAIEYIRKIHDVLPYYKNSRELLDSYSKRLKEKRLAEAQKIAKENEKQDLEIYLEDGLEYLKTGNFEQAAEAFNSAIVIDPHNETAIKGLKAAEAKVTDINAIPNEKDEEAEKRKMVKELLEQAAVAFTNKKYNEAIELAEKIKSIQIKGENVSYLDEINQLVERAKMLQKEEFEPFLIQAKEKYSEGDYNASRDLCEEMIKKDPSYEDAKQCAIKAKKKLNELAREAYRIGYILESMNRIEEAKQYWNRAKNYVRPGDPYYDKILKKIEYYE